MNVSRQFKPLPDQPKQAPADLNRSSINASKRASRHAEHEAAREPGKKLMERDDLDVRGRKIYTFQWLRNMNGMMRLWCEFFQTKLHRLDGPSYFTEGGPRPDRLLLHQFLFWAADTSVGRIYTASHAPSTVTETYRVTARTVERYLLVLATCFAYYNARLDRDLLSSSKLWIRNDLARDLDLNREVKSKPIAYAADVEQLIEAIWNFNSIVVFKSIRAMFNTTLVLNALVDSASRIGEFIPTNTDSKEKGRYLKWQDLDFFMTPTDDVDGITIHIIVNCKWLKKHTHDPSAFKAFIVRLLPPHLAFQDSCRMLVVLALFHGYFRDFRTWQELFSCKPSPSGSPILLKPSCMQHPVFMPLAPRFTKMDAVQSLTESNNSGQMTPWIYCSLQKIVDKMSRLAGFSHKTGLHQLRHGDAFLLAKHCKDRDAARALMGQGTGSEAFSTYLSKTSTTDIQGLARDLPSYDLTPFSGLSLGKCSNAPVTLPAEELNAIDCHPEFLAAVKACADARDECNRRFGSLQGTRTAARESTAATQLLQRYQNLSVSKNLKWKRLAELRYRAFREQSIRELTAAKPAGEPNVGVSEPVDHPESTLPVMDDYRALDVEVEEHTGPDMDSEQFLQDRIEDIGRLTADQTASIIAAVPDASVGGVAESIAESVVQKALDQQVRNHKLLRVELDSMVGTVGRQHTSLSSFSYDYVHLKEKYRMVAKDEGVTSGTVMALLLELLSSECHMRDLPAHWISPGDQSKCVVCGEQLEPDTAYTHVRQCLQTQAQAQADQLWVDYCASLPTKCTWVSTVASKARTHCKDDLANAAPEERQKHFQNHTKSRGFPCYWDGCKLAPNFFSSREELGQHVYSKHGILIWTTSMCMYTWCNYCNKYIFEFKLTPERLAHFASHYDQAIQAVRDYGYPGVSIGSSHAGHRPNEFLPAHCVFCLHDENLNAEDQLLSFCAQREIAPHMHTHFRYLDPSDRIHCPASSAGGARHPLCSYEQSMTATEAWKHVQEIHYALEFGPKWGPGATGKASGKRVLTQADDDSDAEEKVQVRTKVYEKKKPRVVQDDSMLGNKGTKWTASIDQTSKPALPLQEKTPNTRLTMEQIGTPQNQQVDYDSSVIDPLLR
jgi:hypothetical protein